jgi:hypothetical protein
MCVISRCGEEGAMKTDFSEAAHVERGSRRIDPSRGVKGARGKKEMRGTRRRRRLYNWIPEGGDRPRTEKEALLDGRRLAEISCVDLVWKIRIVTPSLALVLANHPVGLMHVNSHSVPRPPFSNFRQDVLYGDISHLIFPNSSHSSASHTSLSLNLSSCQ